MPSPKPQSVEDARAQIVDMLEAMASPEGNGFTPKALDHETAKVLRAERSDDAKTSRVVVEMQVKDAHCNQLANLHGQFRSCSLSRRSHRTRR